MADRNVEGAPGPCVHGSLSGACGVSVEGENRKEGSCFHPSMCNIQSAREVESEPKQQNLNHGEHRHSSPIEIPSTKALSAPLTSGLRTRDVKSLSFGVAYYSSIAN